MSMEIRVDVYPMFEEDRFTYRYVSKIVNEGLKEFDAEWSVDKRIIVVTKRIIDDRSVADIFDTLFLKALKSVSDWKRKLDNIAGCLFFALYTLLSILFIEAYNQTHGLVSFGVFVVGMAFLYIPWWYFHFLEVVLPLLQEQFPLKLEQ